MVFIYVFHYWRLTEHHKILVLRMALRSDEAGRKRENQAMQNLGAKKTAAPSGLAAWGWLSVPSTSRSGSLC